MLEVVASRSKGRVSEHSEYKTGSGAVTLERWTAFKKAVLDKGILAAQKTKRAYTRSWKEAVKGESLSPAEMEEAVTSAARPRHDAPREDARSSMDWPVAVQKYASPPVPRQSFVASPASPWQVPIVKRTDGHKSPGRSSRPARKRSTPCGDTVADLLDARISSLRRAIVRKMRRIATYHTAEWYALSLNKELDERGSRASVSVKGLRRPQELVAGVGLSHMAGVARDYFHDLHTPATRQEGGATGFITRGGRNIPPPARARGHTSWRFHDGGGLPPGQQDA